MPRQGEPSPESSTPDSRSSSSPSSSSHLLASPWGPLGRSLALTVVAAACKAVLLAGNTFEVRDGAAATEEKDGGGAGSKSEASAAAARERFLSLAVARPPGRGLLSVSNHTSTLDDPALFAAMLPLSLFATDPLGGGGERKSSSAGEGAGAGAGSDKNDFSVGGGRSVRWSLCASDICFNKGKLISDFFLAGKTLPVERGGNKGVTQPATEAAAEVLKGGGWVHVFPEGRVEPSGRLPPPLPLPPSSSSSSSSSSAAALFSSFSPGLLLSGLLSRARGLASGLLPASSSSSSEEEKKKKTEAEEEGEERRSTEPETPPSPPPRPPRRAFRRGGGALFCDCLHRGGQPPVLLPVDHSGMAEVMPRGAKVPRVFSGKGKVVVVVGDEVDVSDLSPGCSSADARVREATWAAIAERLRAELARLEAVAPRNRDQRSEREKARDAREEEEREKGEKERRER